MIIQGTNNPILFKFSSSMESVKEIEISLYAFSQECMYDHSPTQFTEIKHWSIDDVSIEGKTVVAPLTQEESVLFPVSKCIIEIKWLDTDSRTNFAKKINTRITDRFDKTIMEDTDKTDVVGTDQEYNVVADTDVVYKKGYSPYVDTTTNTWWEYDENVGGFINTNIPVGNASLQLKTLNNETLFGSGNISIAKVSLIDNTDDTVDIKVDSTEKTLATVENLNKKVDKVNGKSLSTNDYDNAAKAKVDAIPANPKYTDTIYDDSDVRRLINTKQDTLVSGRNIKSINNQSLLGNGNITIYNHDVTMNDTTTSSVVLTVDGNSRTLASIVNLESLDSAKVDKVSGKGLSTNDFTNNAKDKVDGIPSNPKYTDTVYDDTEIKQQIANKVDKVTGKGLSTNDYTSADKAKVGAIPSDPKYTDTIYDDTEIKQQIASKQDKLIAGDGIVIAADGKTISANVGSSVVMTDNVTGGIDITVNDTTKTLAKEEELDDYATKDYADAVIDNLVISSSTQPTAENNKIWLGDTTDVEIATEAELTALDNKKQDKLVAGANITIAADGKTISATDTVVDAYTKTESDAKYATVNSVSTLSTNVTQLSGDLGEKQDKLIAGTGITIASDGKTISTGEYSLPVATTTSLGGIKVGNGLGIDASGNLSTTSNINSDYSTASKSTGGFWIDNKKILKKTYSISSLSVGTNTVAHGISSIDTIVKLEISSATSNKIESYADLTNIYVEITDAVPSYVYVTIYYTQEFNFVEIPKKPNYLENATYQTRYNTEVISAYDTNTDAIFIRPGTDDYHILVISPTVNQIMDGFYLSGGVPSSSTNVSVYTSSPYTYNGHTVYYDYNYRYHWESFNPKLVSNYGLPRVSDTASALQEFINTYFED